MNFGNIVVIFHELSIIRKLRPYNNEIRKAT
jgi:hypothetical protein